MDTELLKLLRCPETRQEITPVKAEVLARLNRMVKEGRLRNRAGSLVEESLEDGLVREDGDYLYPVRHRIPVMLVDESISLRGLEAGEESSDA